MPESVTLPRPITQFREPVNSIELHAFEDTSTQGVSAVVYAVVEKESDTTQGIVSAKSWLSKQNLTMLRLELIEGHMAVNLAINV